MKKILVVDDELSIRESLKMILSSTYHVNTASDGKKALECIEADRPDLVLLDIIMPEMDGIRVLEEMRRMDASLKIIMLTATRTVKTAVTAMKLGASDYLTKPFGMDELRRVVERVLSEAELEASEYTTPLQESTEEGLSPLIGKSRKMKELFQKIRQVAPNPSTVLITGESGTGKELVARAIHTLSPRCEHPFLKLNCAGIPEGILESELFGHERGAFTGAIRKRRGRFELAHQGSIFLDEIGEISASTQLRLLRVLQEQQFERVGGNKTIQVDVRVISATNRHLPDAIRNEIFRPDLYFRLNVVPIHLPPLRDHKEDIPLLVQKILSENPKKRPEQSKQISPEFLDLLLQYNWPGNVRELENIIERAIALSRGPVLMPSDLPPLLREPWKADVLKDAVSEGTMSLGEALRHFEYEMISKALKKTRFIQTRAARILGISRRILKYRMDNLGIQEEEKE